MPPTPQTQAPSERLESYFDTERKYYADPVPTPMDRLAVSRFVLERIKPQMTAETTGKLSRLAVFFDLRETAPVWLALLRSTESSVDDFSRSLLVVLTVAWIGDDKQWQTASDYYRALLDRTPDPQPLHHQLLNTNDALGPKEGTAALRARLKRQMTQMEDTLKKARQGDPPLARGIELRLNAALEFATLDCDRLDELFSIRRTVAALPPANRIERLASLYTGDARDAVPELTLWAALTLLRLLWREPGPSQQVVPAFLTLAGKYNRVDPAHQPELNAIRARALRAAEYFGEPPGAETRAWLAGVQDMGVDLLVLRPLWEYPARQEPAPRAITSTPP